MWWLEGGGVLGRSAGCFCKSGRDTPWRRIKQCACRTAAWGAQGEELEEEVGDEDEDDDEEVGDDNDDTRTTMRWLATTMRRTMTMRRTTMTISKKREG